MVQVFWPFDHPGVAVPLRASCEAPPDRTRRRARRSPAPPIPQVDDARQEALLLGLRAEGVDHRSDHAGAESERFGRIRPLQFVVENQELDRAPTGPAPLGRPVRDGPPPGGEDARPAHDVVLAGAPSSRRSCLGWREAVPRAQTRRTSSRNATSSSVKRKSIGSSRDLVARHKASKTPRRQHVMTARASIVTPVRDTRAPLPRVRRLRSPHSRLSAEQLRR